MSAEGSYRTAFFEAFPTRPKTFIRGEGPSLAAAEEAAWTKYKRIKECPAHDFERRGREDEYGFCRHCNLFAKALSSLRKCVKCSSKSIYSTVDNKHYCRRHYLGLSFAEFMTQPLSRMRVLKLSFLSDKAILKILEKSSLPWKDKLVILDDDILAHRFNAHFYEHERNHQDFEDELNEETFEQHVPALKTLVETRASEMNFNLKEGEET